MYIKRSLSKIIHEATAIGGEEVYHHAKKRHFGIRSTVRDSSQF
jgi:hypothetical protein